MSQQLKHPSITKELLGIEHDLIIVYAYKDIAKYEQRLKELEECKQYIVDFNKGVAVGSAKKSIADLDFRINRLKNIINAKQSYKSEGV